MKHSGFLPAIILVVITICASCYYDNEELLYPSIGKSCETNNITFSTTITAILSNSCLSCHSNTTAATSGNNIRLQNYSDVQARAAAISGAVNHTGTYSPMPKNGGKINPCSIIQFDLWVSNGTPDN